MGVSLWGFFVNIVKPNGFILKVTKLLLVTVLHYWKRDANGNPNKSAAFDFVLN